MEKNIFYIAGAILLLLVAMFIMLRHFTKKFGTDKITSVLSEVKEGIEKVDTTLEYLGPVLPNSVMNIADTILKYSYIAVAAVERMYLGGKIDKDTRRPLAGEKVEKILKLIGIDVTPEMEEVVDISIEAAVNSLPKTHPVAKVTKSK